MHSMFNFSFKPFLTSSPWPNLCPRTSTWFYHNEVKFTQLCLTLCNPMDWSPPGSFVHGVFQARILERVAIPFSRGSSQPSLNSGLLHWQADSWPSERPGKSTDSIITPIQLSAIKCDISTMRESCTGCVEQMRSPYPWCIGSKAHPRYPQPHILMSHS